MINVGYTRVAAICGLTVLIALSVTGFGRPAAAQSDQPLLRVIAPEGATVGDKDVVVQVQVENVTNLGAFQFQLKYDPDVLQVAKDGATDKPMIQRGDFLGSSGREVVCDDPVSQAGVLRVVCITLRPEPKGPDGSGTLSTIIFEAVGKGATELTLDRVQLTDPEAKVFEGTQIQAGTLEVAGKSSFNWMLWGPIIGVIALAVVAGGAFAATRVRGKGAA